MTLILWRYFFTWPRFKQTSNTFIGSDGRNLDGKVKQLEEPTALIVSDHAGHSKWTVAIPLNATFPLHSKQYQHICAQADVLSARLHKESRLESQIDKIERWRPRGKYYSVDRTFLDIAEAERMGVLPSLPQQSNTTPGQRVCEKSLTFSMDTTDSSFGKSLLMLWLSYGLAKKEGRAFFLDDTRWPYGKYSLYFAGIPTPDCAPAPSHQVVPCPHHARHLLVSTATAHWTFGEAFHEAFSLSRRRGTAKSQPIYDLIRKGYEDLFQLVGEDSEYATARIAQIKEEAKHSRGKVIGVHIRRGDLHPHEYQFARDYLPLSRYGTEARKLFHSLLLDQHKSPHATSAADLDALLAHSLSSPFLLSSDDPEILNVPSDLAQSVAPFNLRKVQERIQLATKYTLDQSSPAEPIREPGSAYVKHVVENAGWEGGFYSALFYALGRPREGGLTQETLERLSHLPAPIEGDGEKAVSEQTMRLRELVGRAYILDLAVLAQSDGVVCAVSSAACRILGVMIGWEKVSGGAWVNVDDARPWSWDGREMIVLLKSTAKGGRQIQTGRNGFE